MAKIPPSYPFYADDWLDNPLILDMGLECEGAYCRLLAAMWTRGGSVPDSTDWICNCLRIKPAKWRKIRAVLTAESSLVFEENGRLFNPKLSESFQKFEQKSKKNANSANKRWGKTGKTDTIKPNKINVSTNANAMRTQCERISERIPESKTKRDVFKPPEWVPLDLWKAYLKSRRQKKHPMNSESLALCVKAIEKTMNAGIDVDQILTKMVETGWRSCRPDWFQNDGINGARQVVDHAKNAKALADKLQSRNTPKVVN